MGQTAREIFAGVTRLHSRPVARIFCRSDHPPQLLSRANRLRMEMMTNENRKKNREISKLLYNVMKYLEQVKNKITTQLQIIIYKRRTTLKVLNLAGIKFRDLREFWSNSRNLIPANSNWFSWFAKFYTCEIRFFFSRTHYRRKNIKT